MKKLLKLFSVLLGSTLVLAGCDDFAPNWPMSAPTEEDMAIDTPWADYSVSCASITLGKGENALELNKGETHQYTYTIEPRNANLSSLVWESDDPTVATVENGLLTAVGGGSANITVTSGDVVARSRVKVTVPITNFEISNKSLDLDLGEKAQLQAVFTPSDTTQNGLTYTLDSDEVVSVSESGLVTAKKAGVAEIRVTNDVMNKVETVNVAVSDKWNYVDSLSLSGPAEVEITKAGTIACDVVAVDTTKDASTLAYHHVKFAEKKANADSDSLIEIDETTGQFTALATGDATVVATLYDDRKGEDISEEISFHIYEVKATAIAIDPDDPINLDNETNLTAELSYAITLDRAGATKPSRGYVTYVSSDTNVAKVNDDGLVEPVGHGTATIKAKYINPYFNPVYEVESAPVTVNVTINAKSIALSASSDKCYIDESMEIIATVNPSNTSDALVWHYDDSTGHTYVVDGNKLTITFNNTATDEVWASVGSVESEHLELEPEVHELNFENGKAYIVGSSNYKTGVSKDAGPEGSWENATYAYVFKDKTGNAYAKYEYKATITFRENDLWKIRENESDWKEIEGYVGEGESRHQVGRYKVTDDAFAAGKMSVTAGNEIKVNEAGKYDIYFAYYLDENSPAEGWYEVSAVEHGLVLSSTNVHAKLTENPATISTIKTSGQEGTLSVADVDEAIITVEISPISNNIFITPVAVGNTTFKVRDTVNGVIVKEIVVNVDVAVAAHATSLYLRGSAAGGWDINDDYVLRESADDSVEAEILGVELGVGEFKIADESWAHEYGWTNNDHTAVTGTAAVCFSAGAENNNISCIVAGTYNIYLKTNHDIQIETESGEVPVNLSPYYVRGSAVGSWDALPANQMSVGTGNCVAEFIGITLSAYEFKIATADWSKSWGYRYRNDDEAVDHNTIIGGAKDNFEEAESQCNIKCKVAGVYDLYLMDNNYISIEVHSEPVFSLNATSTSLSVDGTFVVTASNVNGTFKCDSISDDSVASVDVDGNNATITALAEGVATISFSDNDNDPIVFTLTVTSAHVHSYDPSTHECSCGEMQSGWTKVTFNVTFDAGYGNYLIVIGSFNGWSTDTGYITLTWSEGNVWTGSVVWENGNYEFKTMHVCDDGAHKYYESSDNHNENPSGGKVAYSWTPTGYQYSS